MFFCTVMLVPLSFLASVKSILPNPIPRNFCATSNSEIHRFPSDDFSTDTAPTRRPALMMIHPSIVGPVLNLARNDPSGRDLYRFKVFAFNGSLVTPSVALDLLDFLLSIGLAFAASCNSISWMAFSSKSSINSLSMISKNHLSIIKFIHIALVYCLFPARKKRKPEGFLFPFT